MSRTRTDALLEGWKMASHSAQRPEAPPARAPSRAVLPLGILAAAAVVILALVLGSRMLSSGPSPDLPAVGASAPAATATPGTPAPTATPAPTTSPAPSATARASAAGSPSAVDVAAAKAYVETYTSKLKNADTTGAWRMLGARERLKFPSEAQWAMERYQFFQGVKSYTVITNPKDVEPITAWLQGTNGATIDPAHAVLVEVHYTGVPGPANWDLYIVNKTSDGLEIYNVR